MDVDTASDNTSIDDKIDDFCENPTRDALTEGLMSLLKPTVDQLDERIRSTRCDRLRASCRGRDSPLSRAYSELSSNSRYHCTYFAHNLLHNLLS